MSLENFLEGLNNPNTAAEVAREIANNKQNRGQLTPEFIEQLTGDAAIILAMNLRANSGGKDLLARNSELVKSFIANNPRTANTLAYSLVETDNGKKLLANDEELQRALTKADGGTARMIKNATAAVGTKVGSVISHTGKSGSVRITN
ncbi:MAG: hypothetical protein R3D71_00080 [Rickettsiales bacterium]